MATLFFSYSHVDENLRDQLEVHLSALKRQNLISAWHDRRITAGTNLGQAIDANLNAAEVILILISPDFIDSDYCYAIEMKRALERHERGEAKVIPVILRPCDWRDLPFGRLMGTPKDNKPVTTWANLDEAFLDVVFAIKNALKEIGQSSEPVPLMKWGDPVTPAWTDAVSTVLESPRSSNLRIKKEFSDLDRDRFRQEGYEFIAKFFENSMRELVSRNHGLDQRFQRLNATHFTAAVYQNGKKVCKGAASISSGMLGEDSIEYAMDDNAIRGINEAVSVKADDQTLYFEALGMQSFGARNKAKLTAQGVAELFWELFVRPLQ